MSQTIIQVRTSYAKIGGVYEVCKVVEEEFIIDDDQDIPHDYWSNEYLQVEYYYK